MSARQTFSPGERAAVTVLGVHGDRAFIAIGDNMNTIIPITALAKLPQKPLHADPATEAHAALSDLRSVFHDAHDGYLLTKLDRLQAALDAIERGKV